MNAGEDAYKRARATGDFSGFEEVYGTGDPEPEPQPEPDAVPDDPALIEILKAVARRAPAVLASNWTPAQKAQFIGAAALPVDEALKVEIDAKARADSGMTALDDDMEEQIEATLFAMKVKTEAERRLASENYAGTEELSWDDLEAAETRWLIRDLLPEEGVTFLFARSNIGKTFTYIAMLLHMIFGMTFLGKATRPAKALIVLGEGKSGFIDRLKAWCIRHDKTLDDLKPWLSFIDRANLNNDESLDRITEVAEREGVELVVFDTWAATSGVHKEEDNALNAATLNRVKDALPGRALLFVHHPRKAEEDTDHPIMRGAGSLFGAAEVVMAMYRDRAFNPSSGEAADFLALSTEENHGGKNRVAATETIRGLYLDEVDLANGEVGRVVDQVTSEAISKEAREVRKYLTRDMSAAEFCEVYPKSRATAYKHLAKAMEDGVATKIKGPLDLELYHPVDRWNTLMAVAA